MKRISSLLVGTTLILASSISMATAVTSLDSNWTCSTNASSSSVESDKAADKDMSEKHRSAAAAYAQAAKNCRDCTKITCEAND